MNNLPTLGGPGFLGLPWLGDCAKLPHQTEQVHLEPVLLDSEGRRPSWVAVGSYPLEGGRVASLAVYLVA